MSPSRMRMNRPGHAAAVGPEGVFDPVGEALHDLADLEVDDDARGVFALDRRGHVGRGGEDGLLDRHRLESGRENDRALGGTGSLGAEDGHGGEQQCAKQGEKELAGCFHGGV